MVAMRTVPEKSVSGVELLLCAAAIKPVVVRDIVVVAATLRDADWDADWDEDVDPDDDTEEDRDGARDDVNMREDVRDMV